MLRLPRLFKNVVSAAEQHGQDGKVIMNDCNLLQNIILALSGKTEENHKNIRIAYILAKI
jgi:hypothetical protein